MTKLSEHKASWQKTLYFYLRNEVENLLSSHFSLMTSPDLQNVQFTSLDITQTKKTPGIFLL